MIGWSGRIFGGWKLLTCNKGRIEGKREGEEDVLFVEFLVRRIGSLFNEGRQMS